MRAGALHRNGRYDAVAVVHDDDVILGDEIKVAAPFRMNFDECVRNLHHAYAGGHDCPDTQGEIDPIHPGYITPGEHCLLDSRALLGRERHAAGGRSGLHLAGLGLPLLASLLGLGLLSLPLLRLGLLSLPLLRLGLLSLPLLRLRLRGSSLLRLRSLPLRRVAVHALVLAARLLVSRTGWLCAGRIGLLGLIPLALRAWLFRAGLFRALAGALLMFGPTGLPGCLVRAGLSISVALTLLSLLALWLRGLPSSLIALCSAFATLLGLALPALLLRSLLRLATATLRGFAVILSGRVAC
jgi:hypothetical protein